jgi:HD-GYP domain-containing protein (c-di-GMP phosphodiesterase class II)
MSKADKTSRPRLVWTLLGALILVAILPLLISHYFLIGINRESLETLEKKYLTRSAVAISSDIDNLSRSYVQQLGKISSGITNAAMLSRAPDPIVASAGADLIQTYTKNDPDLLALRVVNRNGEGAEVVPSVLGPEISNELDRALTRVLETGDDYVGRFIYLPSLNQGAIVVAVPLAGSGSREGGETMGAVEALVSLRTIHQRVGSEAQADVEAFIVDKTGRVLIHSEAAIGVQQPDFSALQIVKQYMGASVPVRLTQTYDDTLGEEPRRVIGTVAPVASTGWGVVVQKEEKRAFASVERMINATMQWGAIAVALALVAGFLFATGISRPIRLLAEKTREIAQGNYQQRVELTSRNEIGDLAKNFNIMSGSIQNAVEDLKKAAQENHLLFVNSIRMLAAAIDAKDPYTRGHSERVARYSIAIGKHLGLPPEQVRNLRISALLHDVGKIGIDDRILRKPGALSEDEFEIMKTHPEKGAAIMSGVAQLIDIIPGMKYHHEKWSGGGYPDGLVGDQIPMQARIVAIADTFDAMTTNRPYQKAMDLGYVVEKIVSFADSRFDPQVVAAFAKAYKAGDMQPEDQVRGAA